MTDSYQRKQLTEDRFDSLNGDDPKLEGFEIEKNVDWNEVGEIST